MIVNIAIEGMDRFRGVARIAHDLPEVVHFAAKDWINVVFEESQQLVPVFRGPLRASGRIDDQGDNGKINISIVYGNEHVDYAVLIHEDLNIVHPEHSWMGEDYNCGGDAKYLETPWNNNFPSLVKSLEAGIRGVFQ